VTFPREGDQNPNRVPADVVFIIRDKPHPVFKRDGADIKYKAKISLKEALTGASLTVPTLDGRKVPLLITDIIKPGATRRIQGHGLPHQKQPTKRGDLVVEFDIQFPDSLPEGVKSKLKDLLPNAR